MDMNFIMKTRIVSGCRCIEQNRALFSDYGKRALIVTGASGAQKSGALDDVTEALRKEGIEYQIFSEAEPNPQLQTCWRGGAIARNFYAQFIIGVGGGSALDAAKAVAVFAANELQPNDLFSGRWSKRPLPILAVGTTAGTGSEANQYSVITVPEIGNKKSFASYECFPQIAFVDPRYPRSMSRDGTISCGLDAFCHATESYFCRTSSLLSRDMAVSAIRLLWPALLKLAQGEELDEADYQNLCYGSVYGGIAIAQTATAFPHSAGYPLTYFHNVPHGRATALFTGAFLRFCKKSDPAGISYLCALCAQPTLDALLAVLETLNPPLKILAQGQVLEYAQSLQGVASLKRTEEEFPEDRLQELYDPLEKPRAEVLA